MSTDKKEQKNKNNEIKKSKTQKNTNTIKPQSCSKILSKYA